MDINIFGITFSPSFYGLMYAVSFVLCYLLVRRSQKFSKDTIEELFFYIFWGVLLGGRIGYVLFYNLGFYIHSPLEILKVWNGGMSFHGGVIGVIIGMLIFSYRKKISFLEISDEISRVIPVGLFFGRIGNYVNKELLGFPYNGFLAVETPNGSFFPSPLLEAFLEGIVLFLLLQIISQKKKFNGQIGCLFLIGYAVFRIFVELFFRQPDAHIGYILPYISLGTLLSITMGTAGIISYIILNKKQKSF